MFARFVQVSVGTFLVLGFAVADVLADPPKNLVGKYEVKGTNPDGKSQYGGTAEITVEKGDTVRITYQIGNLTEIGIGTVNGDTLTVEFKDVNSGGRKGTAKYEIKKNGVLDGHYHYDKDKKQPETLTPVKK
jgi:hypothetical protein